MGVLEGKAVVMTGAGRGIGGACAVSAAAEGARIVINDLDRALAEKTVTEIKAAGGMAVSHNGDISRSKVARELIELCCDEFGAIDGIFNNAGIQRTGHIEDAEEKDIVTMIEVNLLGTIFCGQAALQRMQRQGYGSVVNVTSGSQMGMTGMSVYGATKGGIAALTYCWAAEAAGSRIRINAISPYAMTQMAIDSDAYRVQRGTPPRTEESPPPAANAPLVNFFLSDLSEGINGQTLRISGSRLNMVTHPHLLPPLTKDIWTAELIAEAFKSSLSGSMQPLGSFVASA